MAPWSIRMFRPEKLVSLISLMYRIGASRNPPVFSICWSGWAALGFYVLALLICASADLLWAILCCSALLWPGKGQQHATKSAEEPTVYNHRPGVFAIISIMPCTTPCTERDRSHANVVMFS